jgi:hypothetical protein
MWRCGSSCPTSRQLRRDPAGMVHPILVGLTESRDQRKGWLAQRSAVHL